MPDTLTKADIIEVIQKENGYSRKQSNEVTEILLEIIKQSFESLTPGTPRPSSPTKLEKNQVKNHCVSWELTI